MRLGGGCLRRQRFPWPCELSVAPGWCCSTKQRADEPAEQSPGAAAWPWSSGAWQGWLGHQGPPAGSTAKAANWGLYLFQTEHFSSLEQLWCNEYVLGTEVIDSQMPSLLFGCIFYFPILHRLPKLCYLMLLLAGMTHIASEFQLGLKFTILRHTVLLKMYMHALNGNINCI